MNLKRSWFFLISFSLVFCLLSSMTASESSSQIDEILGSSNSSYEKRFQAIKHLGNGVIFRHADQLISFLKSSESDQLISDSELFTIKNNLTDKVIESKQIDHRMPGLFLSVLANQDQSIVWRDYVIQKVPHVIGFCNRSERSQLIDLMWSALSDRRGVLAGTALIALLRMSNDLEEIRISRIYAIALQIASDSTYSEGSRLSALGIAEKGGDSTVYRLAEEILNDTGSDSGLLCMSAISVLSKDSNENHRMLFEELMTHSDYRLRTAAKAAIKRLLQQEG